MWHPPGGDCSINVFLSNPCKNIELSDNQASSIKTADLSFDCLAILIPRASSAHRPVFTNDPRAGFIFVISRFWTCNSENNFVYH